MLVFIWLIWSNNVHSLFNIHISKSNIQLLSFNIVHWQFKNHISNTIRMRHSDFTSSQTRGHILNPTFLRLNATFVYFTATLMLGVCYGAECDILAAQCNILVRTLDFMFEWAHLKMVSRCAKTRELKIPKIRVSIFQRLIFGGAYIRRGLYEEGNLPRCWWLPVGCQRWVRFLVLT